MKITAVAAAALLAGSAYADDAQKVLSDDKASTASESATSVTPQIPTFTNSTFFVAIAPHRRRVPASGLKA
ncbi:hypothetical protein COL922a_000169 [Colletotrichum nupharicola]|nr:hypothetical protein COL922a_000169 [Colletotrichum nupharicola]